MPAIDSDVQTEIEIVGNLNPRMFLFYIFVTSLMESVMRQPWRWLSRVPRGGGSNRASYSGWKCLLGRALMTQFSNSCVAAGREVMDDHIQCVDTCKE